jgi:exodeoxyribonuclease V beta subunit
MEAIAAATPGTVSVERATGPRDVRWRATRPPARDLDARAFTRRLDATWRRTSYSALTSAAKDPGVASEPEDAGTVDEDIELAVPAPSAADAERERLATVALPLAAIAGGPRVGTLLHGVLEHTDFTAVDLTGELRTALAGEPGWDPVGVGPADALVGGLALAIDTPLGPLAPGLRLRDIPRRDRLDELTFELPLAGGDAPSADVGVRAIADLLEQHLAPDDALVDYPARLRDPLLDQPLRGYLNGSIDAVLRLPASDGPPAFAVVDYKSNWLGPERVGRADLGVADASHLVRSPEDPLGSPAADLSAWHYRPDALGIAMQHAHYPLQALLYTVALHRFLRWRVAAYDPDVHLAGVLYLFLRGMIGPDTPLVDGEPCGVFSWRPSGALVVATSELLDHGTRS